MKHSATLTWTALTAVLLIAGGVIWMSRPSSGAGTPQGTPIVPAPQIHRLTARAIDARVIEGRPTDREVVIEGSGYYGTAFGPFVRFNGADAVSVIIESPGRIVACAPSGVRGRVDVVVENPDHQAAKSSFELK
jgi:hypothetical protein